MEVAELESYMVEDCRMQDKHITQIMSREKTSTIRQEKYDYEIGQVLRMKLDEKDSFVYAVILGKEKITVPHDLDDELLSAEGNYESVDSFYDELESLGFDTGSFPRDFVQYDIEIVNAFKESEDPWKGKEIGRN